MNGRVDDCYPAMLKHWVEQATPTLYTLIEALESNVIGRSDLAGEIQSQYKIVARDSTEKSNSIFSCTASLVITAFACCTFMIKN